MKHPPAPTGAAGECGSVWMGAFPLLDWGGLPHVQLRASPRLDSSVTAKLWAGYPLFGVDAGGDALFAARIRWNGRSCRSACGVLAAAEFQGRRDFAGWNKSPGTPGNGELLTLKKPAHPPARMLGPGAALVEPGIGLPVAQCGAGLALALVSEGQVIVGVGIARRQGYRLKVGSNGLLWPLHLVEHVAQIEEGQHVGRVSFSGSPVEFFCPGILSKMKVDGSQINVGRRIGRFQCQDFLV